MQDKVRSWHAARLAALLAGHERLKEIDRILSPLPDKMPSAGSLIKAQHLVRSMLAEIEDA